MQRLVFVGRRRVSSLASRRVRPRRYKDAVGNRLSHSSSHLGGDGGGGTYYDSQSGRHVPIHDETKITAYLRSSIDDDRMTTRGNDAYLELVEAAEKIGVAGSILTLLPRRQPRRDDGTPDEFRLLEALSNIAENTPAADESVCTLLIRLPISHLLSSEQLLKAPSNVNFCYEYVGESTRFATFTNASKTSIGIFDPIYYIDRNPISVASDVANIIDKTASEGSRGSIPFIVLDPTVLPSTVIKWDYEFVRLCEEISYLDVAGPTMKSRLVVAAHNPDHIGECLSMGISKYIVDDVECLETLGDVVDEAGKELILDVR